MIPGNDPPAAGSTAVLDEREKKSRDAETTKAVASARGGGDFEARGCGARCKRRAMPQKQAERAAVAGGERKPPRCCQVGRSIIGQFGDNAAESAAFERFLHGKERIDGARHAQDQKSLRPQAEQIEPGAIRKAGFAPGEIGWIQSVAWPARAASERASLKRRERWAQQDNFMQGLARKTPPRQNRGRNAERQHVLREPRKCSRFATVRRACAAHQDAAMAITPCSCLFLLIRT